MVLIKSWTIILSRSGTEIRERFGGFFVFDLDIVFVQLYNQPFPEYPRLTYKIVPTCQMHSEVSIGENACLLSDRNLSSGANTLVIIVRKCVNFIERNLQPLRPGLIRCHRTNKPNKRKRTTSPSQLVVHV